MQQRDVPTRLNRFLRYAVTTMCIGMLISHTTRAQTTSAKTLDATSRSTIIEKLAKELNDKYIFPDIAKQMEAILLEHLNNGDYDDITSEGAFAAVLTAHLRAVSHDKHLEVFFSYESLPDLEVEPSPEEIAQWQEDLRREKFGFYKVEILAGNIGYIDFRFFGPPDLAGEAVAGYMNTIADTSALILDLRNNGGGDPDMVAFISSYLFDTPTHLNDIYWRTDDTTRQFWSYAYVPGPRFGGTKPIYVLTSSSTFSAAEEFAYNLQNLKRATIIGDVTGGGAHPTGGYRITDHIGIGIPIARAINPISKTNWEGVGVQPDIKIPSYKALDAAHKLALETTLASLGSNPQGADATLADEIKQALTELEE